MANWLEVTVPAHGDPEALCDRLAGLGLEGFQIEDERDFRDFLENNTQYWDFVDEGLESSMAGTSRVKFWLADDGESQAVLARLRQQGFEPSVKTVADADWENNWRNYYQPLEIGRKLAVVPQWRDYKNQDRIPVRLDPGLLFGTGDHPTTHMCLEAVERLAKRDRPVLDLGCGSGILGIAAAVLGAGPIVAVDVDEKAPDIVRANAALNGVEGAFTVYTGDVAASDRLRSKLGGGYQLVLANIVADVIISLAPHVPSFLETDGAFVCSGIIDGREDDVETALQEAGLTVRERRHKDQWHCFVCGKERR